MTTPLSDINFNLRLISTGLSKGSLRAIEIATSFAGEGILRFEHFLRGIFLAVGEQIEPIGFDMSNATGIGESEKWTHSSCVDDSLPNPHYPSFSTHLTQFLRLVDKAATFDKSTEGRLFSGNADIQLIHALKALCWSGNRFIATSPWYNIPFREIDTAFRRTVKPEALIQLNNLEVIYENAHTLQELVFLGNWIEAANLLELLEIKPHLRKKWLEQGVRNGSEIVPVKNILEKPGKEDPSKIFAFCKVFGIGQIELQSRLIP